VPLEIVLGGKKLLKVMAGLMKISDLTNEGG
jgi:hypothetical protein